MVRALGGKPERIGDYNVLEDRQFEEKGVLVHLRRRSDMTRTRPFPIAAGTPTRCVTARRRAETALRESEEKLRLLANTIPQLAWMADPDGNIFWYSRRWKTKKRRVAV